MLQVYLQILQVYVTCCKCIYTYATHKGAKKMVRVPCVPHFKTICDALWFFVHTTWPLHSDSSRDRTRLAAKFVGSRHCATAYSLQSSKFKRRQRSDFPPHSDIRNWLETFSKLIGKVLATSDDTANSHAAHCAYFLQQCSRSSAQAGRTFPACTHVDHHWITTVQFVYVHKLIDVAFITS